MEGKTQRWRNVRRPTGDQEKVGSNANRSRENGKEGGSTNKTYETPQDISILHGNPTIGFVTNKHKNQRRRGGNAEAIVGSLRKVKPGQQRGESHMERDGKNMVTLESKKQRQRNVKWQIKD